MDRLRLDARNGRRVKEKPSAVARNHRPDFVVVLGVDSRLVGAGDAIRFDIAQKQHSAIGCGERPELGHIRGFGGRVGGSQRGHNDCRAGRMEVVQREVSPFSGAEVQENASANAGFHHEHFINGHAHGQHRLVGGVAAIGIRTSFGNVDMHGAVQKARAWQPCPPCRAVVVTRAGHLPLIRLARGGT